MNLSELGALLKQQRELRRLSVRDVMDATKISRRNLNALEAGEVRLLPHPVYLKGYVRNYARLVGLDPEQLVVVVDQQSDCDSGYIAQVASAPAPVALPAEAPKAEDIPSSSAAPQEEAPAARIPEPEAPTPQPEPTPAPAPEPAEPYVSQIRFPDPEGYTPRRRKRLWPWLALLLFAAAMVALYHQYERIVAELEESQKTAALATAQAENATNATTEANATASVLNATLPEANATVPQPEAQPAPAPVVEPTPAPAKAAAAAAPAPSQAAQVQSAPAQAAKAAPVSVPSASIEVSRKSQTPATAPNAAPAAESRTPGAQELVISAKPGETCWVEVSDGQMRKSFTLKDGESRRVEFSGKAKVRLGNAGGVSFQLNGSHYAYEGERGQTATVEIGAR